MCGLPGICVFTVGFYCVTFGGGCRNVYYEKNKITVFISAVFPGKFSRNSYILESLNEFVTACTQIAVIIMNVNIKERAIFQSAH